MVTMVSCTCKQCQCNFERRKGSEGSFCSISCSTKHQHSKARGGGPPKRIPLNPSSGYGSYTCAACGIGFVRRYQEVFTEQVFCSHTCQAKLKPPPKPADYSTKRRSSALQNKNRQQTKFMTSCSGCGATTNLQSHHVVPYRENKDLAAVAPNLVMLCVTCHAAKHPEHANLITANDKTTVRNRTRTCSHCGKAFQPYNGVQADRPQVYCTSACYYADPNRPVRGGLLRKPQDRRKRTKNDKQKPVIDAITTEELFRIFSLSS